MLIRTEDRESSLDVAVIGAGYVGLVTAACLAHLGHRLTLLEVSAERLDALRAGRVPFREAGLPELVAAGMAAGRIRVTDDASEGLAGRDAILICVGTPLDEAGGADLSQLRSACEAIAEHGGDDATIVIRSTLPLGITASIPGWLRRADSTGIVTNPEFQREGTAVSDFLAPTRIVIGTTDGRRTPAARVVERLFAGIEAPIVVTDYASADMIKNAANAFLATRLSFINEIADLCEAYGADIDRVIEGIGLDPRIGQAYLRPGIGFGGSCLPKELNSLMRLGRGKRLAVHLLSAASAENGGRAERIARRLDLLADGLAGRRVALLGLSFKPLTDDLRHSPSMALAAALLARGAHVVAHDPVVSVESTGDVAALERAADVESACLGAELVVLATEWPEYRALDWRHLAALVRRPFLFDGRNALDVSRLRESGWTVARIGQAHPLPPIERRQATIDRVEPVSLPDHRARLRGVRTAAASLDARASRPTEESRDERGVGGPRFLLYSHDAFGLGHVRRNLILALALAERAPEASILLASGAEGLESLSVPTGVDVLRLPGLRKTGEGKYLGRRLNLGPSELVRLRAGLLASAVEQFRPHVLLADKHPIGVGGELLPALRLLRRDGGRAALGLRDVLDDPNDTANEWRRASTGAWVAEFHDLVLVYGSQTLLNPMTAGLLPRGKAPRVQYCGYVVDGGGTSFGLVPPDLPSTQRGPLVLATTGGGEDGLPLLEAFVDAARSAPWRGVLVAGPQLEAAEWTALEAQAKQAGVVAYRAVHEVHRWFPHVGGLVCMGGYNTLLEAVSSGTPTVCVPRTRPRREQLIRARAFAAEGLLQLVEPGTLTGGRLRLAIDRALQTPRIILAERTRTTLDLGGAQRAATLLLELAGGARPVEGDVKLAAR